MARIILGTTGSVAAVKTPVLLERLEADGHDVRVVATEPSLYFFDPAPIAAQGRLFRDRDEWPGDGYQRDDPVLHIVMRDWAELLILAPLDANTLGKLALGLCDNLLTSLLRAWNFALKPVLLAPAMNTMMWEKPATLRHLRRIVEDWGDGRAPTTWGLDQASAVFARHCRMVRLIAPQAKRLACGDVGMGAMAEVDTIAAEARDVASRIADA